MSATTDAEVSVSVKHSQQQLQFLVVVYTQGYMSLDARVRTPRADRVATRRRRRKVNVVERVWAYEMMRELTQKATQSTDNTASTIVLATVQEIASQVLPGVLVVGLWQM